MTFDEYDPSIEGNTFFEGSVVWDMFLWMLTAVAPHQPVVADTPFNHAWNRQMLAQVMPSWEFPVVEVALRGDPATLLARARVRAGRPEVHEIKRRFSVRPQTYEQPYQPVLDAARVVEVDTTDLGAVNVEAVANKVQDVLER